MVKTQQNYLEKEIMQGTSLDHINLLYGKAINSLRLAKKILEEGESTLEAITKKANALSKATDILIYLQAILDLKKGGEIAKNLNEIYEILINELISCSFSPDLKKIEDAIEILENLKKTWHAVKEINMPKPNHINVPHTASLKA
ncbi:MAG: flagellar export chaperone FliS [Caldimicrobium sp.]